METPSDISDAPRQTPAAEPEASASSPMEGQPATPAEQQPALARSFFKLERGDVLPFCLLIGFSAWLWSRASDSLGSSAAFIGAAIGLVIAYVVRTFC